MKNFTTIKLPFNNQKFDILSSEIVMAESHLNYSEFTLLNGQKSLISYTLGNYEDMLCDMNFIRIHRKFLINLEYVKSFRTSRDGGQVTLINDTIMPISRRKVSNFKKQINKLSRNN